MHAPGQTADRPQSSGEEVANAVSHGLGLVASLVAAPILIVNAVREGGTAAVVGASIFAATLMLLYLASTLYHALPAGRAKRVFKILDHCAIYLLIAGTYTPFTLGVLHGAWGWSLFGVVWGLALIGILTKTVFAARGGVLSTGLYLGMGWLAVVAVRPMLEAIPVAGLAWLVGGGLAYTLGVGFYLFDGRVRYAHFLWHLFVALGSVSHVIAVYGYAV